MTATITFASVTLDVATQIDGDWGPTYRAADGFEMTWSPGHPWVRIERNGRGRLVPVGRCVGEPREGCPPLVIDDVVRPPGLRSGISVVPVADYAADERKAQLERDAYDWPQATVPLKADEPEPGGVRKKARGRPRRSPKP